jgi:hypothetical protein
MSTAKMLPWLANTSGIELERAEQLWQTASGYATNVTGESESTRYLTLAHEHMIALVENEMLTSNVMQEAPWLMIQAHVSVAPMIVADIFAQATALMRQAICRWTEKKHSAA